MIYWILSIAFLLLIFYLYKTSKSDFFLQDPKFLAKAKIDLVEQLKRYGRNEEYIKRSLRSFNYFVVSPKRYDGATIVRDVYDVRYHNPNVRLSISSMNHDYDWIHGANRNYWKCLRSNYKYVFNDLLGNGKGLYLERFVGLNIIMLFYVPIKSFQYYKNKLK